MIDDKTATRPRNMSFKTYKKIKLKMLQRDFCIYLDARELVHYNTLTTEAQVDQFCIGMLNKYWG